MISGVRYGHLQSPWDSPLSFGVQALIEFNNLIINDRYQEDRIRVLSLTGLDDADISDSRDPIAGDHGEFPYDAFYRGRTFVLTGDIQAGSLGVLKRMERDLKAAFAPLTEAPMKFRWFDVVDTFDDPATVQANGNYTALSGSLSVFQATGGLLTIGASSLFPVNLITNPSAEASQAFWNPTTPARVNLCLNPSAEADASLPGWSASVPTRTNLVTNPSFENPSTGTAGYTANPGGYVATSGCTIARTTSQSIVGSASMQVVTAGSVAHEGWNGPGISPAITPGAVYTVSFWAKGNAGGELLGVFLGVNGGGDYGNLGITLTTAWQRFTVTWTAGGTWGSGAGSLFIRSNAIAAYTYFIDGIIINSGSTALPYFDGDTPGYGWTGVPHASTSSNTATVTNLISNPSFETDTIGATPTGWTPGAAPAPLSAAVTVQTAGAYIGTQGMRWVTTTNGQGATVSVPGTFKAGVTYTVTLRAKGNAGGENFTIDFRDTPSADNVRVSPTLTTAWTEYRVSWTPSADRTTVVLSIYAAQTANWTWYVDAIAIFASTNNAGYFDGTFPGASWTGTAHASTSTRSAAGVVLNQVSNPGFETNTTGWYTSGNYLNNGATLTRSTTAPHSGSGCGQVVTTNALAAEGAATQVLASTAAVTYVASIWVKGNAGGELFRLLLGEVGVTFNTVDVTLTTSWQQVIITYTATGGAALVLSARTQTTAAVTFFIDDAEVIFGRNPAAGSSYNGNFTGATTGAWWMGAGLSTLSNSVLPALTQSTDWAASGTKSFRVAMLSLLGSADETFIRSPPMPVTVAQTYCAAIQRNISVNTATGLYCYIEWQNASGTPLSYSSLGNTSSTGTGSFSGSAAAPASAVYGVLFFQNSGTAGLTDFYFDACQFHLGSTAPAYFDGDSLGYNWTGQPHLSRSVNVSLGAVTNLVTNPSFEANNTTGWAGTTGVTISSELGNSLFGSYAMKIVVPGPGADGAKTTAITVTAGTTYTWSFYFKQVAGTARSVFAEIDWGGGGSGSVVGSSQTMAVGGGWVRCTVTGTASAGATTATCFALVSTTASSDLFYLDGAMLTATTATTAPDFFDGDTHGATWTGTRGASTSTSWQGAVLNRATNPNFEAGTTGWTTTHGLIASGATLTQDTTQPYQGTYVGKVVTTNASPNEGVVFPFSGFFKAGVTYTLTVRLRGNAGGESMLVTLIDPNNIGDYGQITPTLTTSWAEYRVAWTPTADRTTAAIRVCNAGSVAMTYYVDAALVNGAGWSGGVSGKDSGYFDGNMPNASWTGTANASISKRDPGGIINLISNGGFEDSVIGTTGWAGNGAGLNSSSTISRVTSQHQFGSASMQVVTPGSNGFEGARYPLTGAWASGTTLTATVWLKGNAGGETVQIFIEDGSFTDTGSTNITLTTGWQQVAVTKTTAINWTNAVLCVRTQSVAHAYTFFVDGAMMTQTSATPAYFDGSYSGAFWGGAAGNSYSILPTLTRDTTWASSGTTSFRFANVPITGELPAATGPAFNCTAGQQFGARVATNTKALSGAAVNAQILWSTGGTSLIGAVPASGIGSESAVVTAPGGATSGQVQLVANGTGGLIDIDFDAVLVSQGSSIPTYFDGDTAGHYWTGTPELSTSGTIVSAQLLRSSEQRVYGDSQQTARLIVASITSQNTLTFLPKVKDANNYVSCSYNQAAGTPTLTISSTVAGVTYQLASLTIPTAQRPIAGQAVWVRGKIEGDLVTAEYWISKPANNQLPASYLTANLTGSDADTFGNGILSQVGFGASVTDGTWAIDDYKIESISPGDVHFYARKVGKLSITDQQSSPSRFKRSFQITMRASKFVANGATQMRSPVLVPVAGTTPILGRTYPRTYPLVYRKYLPGTITQAVNILNVRNRGTVFSKPKIFVYGAISNLVIINLTNGQQMAWNGTLADGDYLIFDCQARTVVNSAGQNMAQYFVPTSSWIQLEPGWNDLYVGGSGFSANTKIVAFGRHAWL